MINILIVDDSKVAVKKIESILSSLGYNNFIVAKKGEKAIDLVKKETIDLIIMDIVLEGTLDGVEVSKLINEYKIIPTIYLTGDIKNFRRLPTGTVYLNKPFTKNELKHNIDIVLEQHILKEKLKEEVHWFGALFNSSKEGIIMFDKNFKINRVNEKYKEIFDYNYEKFLNSSLRDIVGSHLSFLTLEKNLLLNQSLEVEKELIFDLGKPKYFLIKGMPIYKDKEIGSQNKNAK